MTGALEDGSELLRQRRQALHVEEGVFEEVLQGQPEGRDV